jgi:hypothetical protein
MSESTAKKLADINKRQAEIDKEKLDLLEEIEAEKNENVLKFVFDFSKNYGLTESDSKVFIGKTLGLNTTITSGATKRAPNQKKFVLLPDGEVISGLNVGIMKKVLAWQEKKKGWSWADGVKDYEKKNG